MGPSTIITQRVRLTFLSYFGFFFKKSLYLYYLAYNRDHRGAVLSWDRTECENKHNITLIGLRIGRRIEGRVLFSQTKPVADTLL